MRKSSVRVIGAIVYLLFAACVAKSSSDSTATSGIPTISAPSPEVPFGPTAYGPIRMCAPLDSVTALASRIGATAVRDTVIESEGERWPAKLVVLGDGGTALFESSWMDTTSVWRFGTTSPHARTDHGAHAGARLGELPAASGPFAVEVSEGAVRIKLAGDGVGARVDAVAEHAAQEGSATKGEARRAPPDSARVLELLAAGRCETRR